MHQPGSEQVWGKDGLHGTILQSSSNTASPVLIRLDRGQRLLVPADMLVRQQDGSYYLPLSPAEVEQFRATPRLGDDETLTVPVIVEEIEVQKQLVETGKVRITKIVHEREAIVDEPLCREEVEVERVPIHRLVDGPIPVRYEGETMIVSIMEETLVVEKRLMLKEELHVRKRRLEAHQPQKVTLRSEEARVERMPLTDAAEQ
jgi:uncharacterized protein (TIGR02271 family)